MEGFLRELLRLARISTASVHFQPQARPRVQQPQHQEYQNMWGMHNVYNQPQYGGQRRVGAVTFPASLDEPLLMVCRRSVESDAPVCVVVLTAGAAGAPAHGAMGLYLAGTEVCHTVSHTTQQQPHGAQRAVHGRRAHHHALPQPVAPLNLAGSRFRITSSSSSKQGQSTAAGSQQGGGTQHTLVVQDANGGQLCVECGSANVGVGIAESSSASSVYFLVELFSTPRHAASSTLRATVPREYEEEQEEYYEQQEDDYSVMGI
jgi:hypothetical protein